MKPGIRQPAISDDNILRKKYIHLFHHFSGTDIGIDLKASHLSQCMHTGIGTARALYLYLLLKQLRK